MQPTPCHRSENPFNWQARRPRAGKSWPERRGRSPVSTVDPWLRPFFSALTDLMQLQVHCLPDSSYSVRIMTSFWSPS